MTAKSQRFQIVDVARGLAILGVVVFHTVWDLRYFGFTQFNAFWDPFWLGFAKVLVNSFMALVGVSLVLAHRSGVRWRAFWRRWRVIALSAIGVSVVTYFAFGEGFVYFGVLHAIAVFSLLGLVFLSVPLIWVLVAGAVFIVPPLFWSDPLFNAKWLSWIGFWTQHPNTQDLVPFFNGFGTTLWGIFAARLALRHSGAASFLHWQNETILARFLAWCGQKSLILYLTHQPIVFGVLYALWWSMQPR